MRGGMGTGLVFTRRGPSPEGACLHSPCREQAGQCHPALCGPEPFQCFSSSPACVPERFWYCRLALNHKVLHYGDLDDNPQGEVTFESLQEKSRFIFLFVL